MTELTSEEINEIYEEEHERRLAIDEFNLYGEEGSKESQLLRQMSIRNRVIKTLSKDDEQAPKLSESKSITFRLNFKDYARLKILSDKLKQSPSGLARTLLIDGMSEATNAYFEVVGDKFIEGFDEELEKLESDFINDMKKGD